MSLGDASSSVGSFNKAHSLDSPRMDSHGIIKLRMDGNDPYIGFEDFLALEYPINLEGDDLLVIEEEEEEENLLAIEEDLGVGEGQGEEGENYEEQKNEQSGRKSKEDEDAISDTVQPYIGREFMSADEAYNFYNAYAGHVGFSIRRITRTISRNSLSSVRLVCSKEGFSPRQIAEQKRENGSSKSVKTPEREYGTTRTGCKACLRVKLVKGGVWRVTVFMDDHNHDLIRSPSKIRNLRSQKCIIAEDKEIIKEMSAQNIGTSQILEYIGKKRGGKRKLTFKKKDVSNQIATQNRKLKGVDVKTTLAYFRKKQEEDAEFFYAIDADENGAVQHIFWVDGRARRAYLEFGDVVTFDTTFNTNRYSMPLAPFIGVNHHRHSIFFGMALLRSDKERNFTWLFETWITTMYGKYPKAIITDQDPAMRVAIRKVFPNIIHRCCQWHVMRKTKEKFMSLYNSKPSFKDQLGYVINSSLTILDFEKAWAAMLDKFELNDNNHLKVMYHKRAEWVPAYFRNTFFAEMSTTQRSESMNAILKLWVHNHTSIYQFVINIESMVEGIWHKESDEDIKTMNEVPRLWSKYQIEQEARQVYTRSNFSVFKEILKETTLAIVVERERDILYEVITRTNPSIHNWVPENYMVEVDKDNERFSCNCKGFEFEDFLCQHAIKVMHHVGTDHLPSHYIIKRWCKEANANAKRSAVERSMDIGESEALRAFRKATLCKELKELEDIASQSGTAFRVVRSRICEIKNEVRPIVAESIQLSAPIQVVENGEVEMEDEDKEDRDEDGVMYLDPPISQCKGRKKKPVRFKPIVENIARQGISCSYCHAKEAHNIRTCPKRKEDLANGKKMREEERGINEKDSMVN